MPRILIADDNAPNADLLWRKLRSEDAWGSLRSERGEAG